MVEYVTLHVLHHHRRMTEFGELQSRREWKYLAEPAAHEVRVGLMGLGVMGLAAVAPLRLLGYQLRGWSRTPKTIEGVQCYCGEAGLDAFLADTDILAVRAAADARDARHSQPGADPQAVAPGPRRAPAGAGADQCRARRPAGRCGYRGGAAGRRAVRGLARRVRDRAAAGGRARCGRTRASSSRRTTRRKARRWRSCAMPCASGSGTSTACRSRTSSTAGAGIEALVRERDGHRLTCGTACGTWHRLPSPRDKTGGARMRVVNRSHARSRRPWLSSAVNAAPAGLDMPEARAEMRRFCDSQDRTNTHGLFVCLARANWLLSAKRRTRRQLGNRERGLRKSPFGHDRRSETCENLLGGIRRGASTTSLRVANEQTLHHHRHRHRRPSRRARPTSSSCSSRR